jgi:hypothetical protein
MTTRRPKKAKTRIITKQAVSPDSKLRELFKSIYFKAIITKILNLGIYLNYLNTLDE